ncbi:hypothetical protein [Janthinobacterium sp. LB2P10]|uniref:hypothetical protein n=1 Tax=Janthinobacterium sp. LB2P10 TaxID=3424194 RepID=UPI003F21E6C6
MYKRYNFLRQGSFTILRVADNAWIPPDIQNRDYMKYLEWVQAGNTAEIVEI